MSDRVFGIEGYVKNETSEAFFKLQKGLPPGAKISFQQAYLVLGKKSGLEGHQFLEWLKQEVFSDPGWVFYDGEDRPYFQAAAAAVEAPAEKSTEEKISPGAKKSSPKKKMVRRRKVAPKQAEKMKEVASVDEARGAGRKMVRQRKEQRKKGTAVNADTMIATDFEQAKSTIDACRNKAELKKALTLSRHFANKEQHMRYILKRLEQV